MGRRIVVFLLLFYKSQISPFLPSACKYQPTCSMYAKDAVERFGVRKGLYLAVKRILRCHPFAQGGFDPVPDA
ncbi:MAG: membrane protein insertion efficiency factor YidD [Acidobacteria bacterium]|nr:membrane protein insertion efficiency factor YidD [Acidobacteriota bacterium]